MVWHEFITTFQTLLRQCEGSAHEIDCSLLRPTCQKTGRAFFEMLSEGQNPFGLGEEFKMPPVAESMPPDGRPIEHYSEYWLCVLGFLAREGHINIGNRKLLRTKIPPISWAAIDYELKVAEQFFIDHRAYICEVCNGSVQVCKKLLEPSEWKPPEGYIASDQIRVPRTTLQGWQERDGIDIKKIRGKNYYPENWVKEKLKSWKRKKSFT